MEFIRLCSGWLSFSYTSAFRLIPRFNRMEIFYLINEKGKSKFTSIRQSNDYITAAVMITTKGVSVFCYHLWQ